MSKGSKKGERRGGRQKGSVNKSTREIKEIIHSEVDFSVVARKMFELVKGVEVQCQGKDGTIYYEDKEPNVNAAKLLLEYAYGKPKEQMDVNHKLEQDDLNKVMAAYSEAFISSPGSGVASQRDSEVQGEQGSV